MRGVKHIEKTVLKNFYKKVLLIPKKIIWREQIREFHEKVYTQYWLDISKYPLIWISLKLMIFGHIQLESTNKLSMLACNVGIIQLSFAIAVSNRGIEEI